MNKLTQTVSAMKSIGTQKVQGKHKNEQIDTDYICHEKVSALKNSKESTRMNKLTQTVSAVKKYWQ